MFMLHCCCPSFEKKMKKQLESLKFLRKSMASKMGARASEQFFQESAPTTHLRQLLLGKRRSEAPAIHQRAQNMRKREPKSVLPEEEHTEEAMNTQSGPL